MNHKHEALYATVNANNDVIRHAARNAVIDSIYEAPTFPILDMEKIT